MIKTLAVITLLLLSGNASAANAPEIPAGGQDDAQTYETFDSLVSLYQPYLTNIAAYEPIYFLAGTNLAKSKFQFSFRYRLLDNKGPAVQNHSWPEGLHFGFTQTSYWNLKSDSLPFEDTSYKPELFHLSKNIKFRPAWMQGFFMQSGIKHESNGQADPLSRSTNILYLRSSFIFYREKTKLGLALSPSVWTYFDNSQDNPDLADYRGYFQLDVALGKADSAILTSNWRLAKEGGSVQVDLSYPAGQALSDNINVYLHFQYVNALAESLLNYQDRTEAFRLGFSFIR